MSIGTGGEKKKPCLREEIQQRNGPSDGGAALVRVGKARFGGSAHLSSIYLQAILLLYKSDPSTELFKVPV